MALVHYLYKNLMKNNIFLVLCFDVVELFSLSLSMISPLLAHQYFVEGYFRTWA